MKKNKRKDIKLESRKILVLCEDSVSFNKYTKFYLMKQGFSDFPIDRKQRSRENIKDETIIIKRKETTIEIRQAKQNSNPELILEEARKNSNKNDIIFREFDYDANKLNCGNRKQEYKNAIAQIDQTSNSKIILINFNLCFENWLLAHYANSSKEFEDSKNVIKELNNIQKDFKYEKNSFIQVKKGQEIFNITYTKISDAIKNAKNIEQQNPNLALKFYIFMDYIENLCK